MPVKIIKKKEIEKVVLTKIDSRSCPIVVRNQKRLERQIEKKTLNIASKQDAMRKIWGGK